MNKASESFICPIIGLTMKDPVVDREGNSYERSAITDWLQKSPTSPITRNRLSFHDLTPNRALKALIDEASKKRRLLCRDNKTGRCTLGSTCNFDHVPCTRLDCKSTPHADCLFGHPPVAQACNPPPSPIRMMQPPPPDRTISSPPPTQVGVFRQFGQPSADPFNQLGQPSADPFSQFGQPFAAQYRNPFTPSKKIHILKVGDRVQLAPDCSRLSNHVLKNGQVGILEEDDNSDRPFKVKVGDSTNWYLETEIVKVVSDVAAIASLSPAFLSHFNTSNGAETGKIERLSSAYRWLKEKWVKSESLAQYRSLVRSAGINSKEDMQFASQSTLLNLSVCLRESIKTRFLLYISNKLIIISDKLESGKEEAFKILDSQRASESSDLGKLLKDADITEANDITYITEDTLRALARHLPTEVKRNRFLTAVNMKCDGLPLNHQEMASSFLSHFNTSNGAETGKIERLSTAFDLLHEGWVKSEFLARYRSLVRSAGINSKEDMQFASQSTLLNLSVCLKESIKTRFLLRVNNKIATPSDKLESGKEEAFKILDSQRASESSDFGKLLKDAGITEANEMTYITEDTLRALARHLPTEVKRNRFLTAVNMK